MVGRLQGTVVGRPFYVEADGGEILVKFDGLGALRSTLPLAKKVVTLVEHVQLKGFPIIKVRCGRLFPIMVRQNGWAWKVLLRLT